MEKEILVDILMPAYNHERFIEKAIQSVLMQECPFNYRLIIGDDCSTDGTPAICEHYASEYPKKILYLKNMVNKGMAANYKTLFDISTAKYLALLEGDDFWIDKHKLKKQTEVLESHSEIGIVHTNYYSLYENGRIKKGHLGERLTSLSGNVIGPSQTAEININPLTTCFRSFLAKENIDFDFIINNNLLTVDIFLWAEICRRSGTFYLDQVTGIYRIHSNSLTGSQNIDATERFNRTSLISVNYIMDKYNANQDIKDSINSRIRINLIFYYLKANQPDKAHDELKNIRIIMTLREQIICMAAKFRPLNFLARILDLYYHFGSMVKQFFASDMIKIFTKQGEY